MMRLAIRSLLPELLLESAGGHTPARRALDTWRFLNIDGRVNYATRSMRVPWPIVDDSVVRDFNFTVDQASLFRLYTEPHLVDIDLALYAVDANTHDQTLIQQSNGFNVEETLVAELSAGRLYRELLAQGQLGAA